MLKKLLLNCGMKDETLLKPLIIKQVYHSKPPVCQAGLRKCTQQIVQWNSFNTWSICKQLSSSYFLPVRFLSLGAHTIRLLLKLGVWFHLGSIRYNHAILTLLSDSTHAHFSNWDYVGNWDVFGKSKYQDNVNAEKQSNLTSSITEGWGILTVFAEV